MNPADELLELLDRVVDHAEGDESVEAYGIDETETTVQAYEGAVESLSSARTRGVGVRIISEGRVGYAYTADLGDRSLAEVVAEARANASVSTPDEANVLPAAQDYPDVGALYDPGFDEVAPEEKVRLALAVDAAAGGEHVKGVESAQYGDSVASVAIASTAGVRAAYRRCDAFVMATVLAEADGQTTSAYGLDLARMPADLDVEAAGAEARERAVRLLRGRKPSSGRMPVVLDPYATASFLGVLAGALTAEQVQKGRSLFADRLGETVAGEHVTLVDDGTLAGAPGTAPWDGEGVAHHRTELIGSGVVRGWLHNAYTAARDETASTGNARRAGFKSAPGVSPTNLFLEPGPSDQAALLAQAGTGFYCQQILGVHSGANPVSGDFSVGAAGVMIRDGVFAEPVREATIASTIPDMLGNLVAVGSDLRFLPFGGGMGGVTVLFEGMTLGGT